jgi:hypothetical protein
MRAHVMIELLGSGNDVLARRARYNSVMRTGATLLAELFTGRGNPITHMAVGISDAPEPDDFSTDALTTDGDAALEGATEVALPADAFSLSTDEDKRLVHVRVRGTLPVNAAVGAIREAGLISRRDGEARLYNRVVFPTISKGDDHELTLFWEVSFPYGDLDGLY